MKNQTTKDRVSAALTAVNAYRRVHESFLDPTDDMETAISDLIADLCHLAAQYEIAPLAMLKLCAEHYAVEAVDDTGNFLEVLVTLEVVARPVPMEEEEGEDFQEFNDQNAARWRAQAQEFFARPKLTIVRDPGEEPLKPDG